MSKQKRPLWPSRPVTPEWKDLVLRTMKGWRPKRMTRKELAKRIGATPPAITQLMRATTRNSRLVDPICDVLRIPSPEYADRRDAESTDGMRELRRVDPELFDDLVAQAMERLRRQAREKR